MSRTGRMVAAMALAGLSVPALGVAPAYAETASEPASIGAYFYSAGIDKPEQSPAQPPNLTGDNLDGVAAGNLAVAVQFPQQVDKLSFLFFDLLTVPFDATITNAVMTVPLAENGGGNTQSSPDPAKVRACPADATGFNGQDAANTMGAPLTLCDEFSATATLSADGSSYVFDIGALASSWLTSANNGVALTVAPEALNSPFQVVFLPFDNAKIAVEYTAPPTETEVLDSGEALSGSLDAGGFTGDTGGLGLGGSTGDVGGFGAPPPLVGGELPAEAAGPAGAPPAVANPPVAVTRTGAASEVLSPTAGFWLGGLLLVAALALLSLIMGDPRTPVAATSQSRLSQALQSRQRGGAGAFGARPLPE